MSMDERWEVMEKARRMIMEHEGFRDRPYRDTKGYLTIGYGKCLDFMPISEPIARSMLDEDITWFMKRLYEKLPFIESLSHARQAVIIDMAYNLGLVGIMKFKKMLAAIERADFDCAAQEMINSVWATQVGYRAAENARIMRTGALNGES